MQLIRERRKHLKFSYKTAGSLIPERPISDTRWRQLEDGYRTVGGMKVAEPIPDDTLAGMAYVVRVTPTELVGFGKTEAARELLRLAAAHAPEYGEAQAEARKMVSAAPGLTRRQQEALIPEISAAILRIREQELSLSVVNTPAEVPFSLRKRVNAVCYPGVLLMSVNPREGNRCARHPGEL